MVKAEMMQKLKIPYSKTYDTIRLYGSGPMSRQIPAITNHLTFGVNNCWMHYDCDFVFYKEKPPDEVLDKLEDFKGTLCVSEYSYGNFGSSKNDWAARYKNARWFEHYNYRSEGIIFEFIEDFYPERPLLVGSSTAITAIDLAVSFGAKTIELVGASGQIIQGKQNIDGYLNPNSSTHQYHDWLSIYRDELKSMCKWVAKHGVKVKIY